MNKTKKFVVINTIIIFLFGFVTHNLYKWFPSFVTAIFPVNESLFEHLKMIFITPVIVSSILYAIFYFQKKKINNFLGSLFISTMVNILSFYLVYLPIYYNFGQNMIITLIVYFISIIVSQYVNYLLINRKNSRLFNVIGLISIVVVLISLLYFTYNPIESDFFLDPIDNVYGIDLG